MINKPIKSILLERKSCNSKPKQRKDNNHISLVIEGGNMRGAISGGMINAIESLGLTNCFDSIYGASAGAMAGAYLASGKAYLGAPLCYQNARTDKFISFKNLLKGKPFANLKYLTHDIMKQDKPVDFNFIKESGVEFFPVASCLKTGNATILKPRNQQELLDGIHASAKIPFFAGGPALFQGRKYFDACATAPVPVEQALLNGASHVLVLKMDKPQLEKVSIIDHLMKLGVKKHSPILCNNYINTDQINKSLNGENIEVIYPSKTISRSEKNINKLLNGVHFGIAAIYDFFELPPPTTHLDEKGFILIKP